MSETKNIKNITLYGIGGQGVLKASEICAWAAMYEGFNVKKTEVHGMAQRGGSVESHLRIGEGISSPVIPFGETDIIVCFHATEHHRFTDSLKENGIDLIKYLDAAEEFSKEDKRYVNTFMLGVLSKYLNIKKENWIKAIKLLLPEKTRDKNKEIFNKGREIGGTL